MSVKVSNITNTRGNKVANQFVIESDGSRVFQSYDSVIAKVLSSGEVLLDKVYWNYSRTTSKHRNIFLSLDTKKTLEKIKSGEFKLVDLNN